ncbi:hypothetical protein [Chrysiogenes arsenatis]|uniref:hypothetical protein n=1 Tax=Chrysiogenes arsenatis TaxID=309797 RepID=UPI0003F4D319|nr:hypothetical protein [Chrysiogenes arsenatis]
MEKDHLEILLEDINGKFSLVLEGHSALYAAIQALSKKTDERFDLVDFQFKAMKDHIDNVEIRLEKRIDGLEKRIDSLETRFDGLEVRFDSLERKVDGIALDLQEHRADTELHRAHG